MKKIIDFEITLCLTIAILLGIVAFCTQFIIPLDSIISTLNYSYSTILKFVAILSFIVVNLLYFTIQIFKLINYAINKTLYNSYIKYNFDDENFDLENYDLLVATALYYTSSRIDTVINIFQKFFKNENYLLENGSINKSKLNELPFCEKSMLVFSDDIKDIDTYYDDIEKRLTDTLINNNFIKFSSIKLLLTSFLRGANDKYTNVSFKKNYNFIFFEFIIFVIIALTISLLGFYFAIILIPFIVIPIVINMDKLFLTERGKIEQAKIIEYKKSLKNKSDLTAREKLFLELLKK